MAELILSTAGQALGSWIAPDSLSAMGGTVGRMAGSYLGARIDNQIFGETRRVEGPRLTDLHVQASTEGASIANLYGRVRIAGQVIWAARHKEHVTVEETSSDGGKGGGSTVRTTRYSYSLSFAIGLCEGEITRIGRVWANGEDFDLSAVAHRLHRGADDQAPDALIEAIQGVENAPGFRGLAYIVFEDLPLDRFGNGVPQMSFEIVRPAAGDGPRLENLVQGVCLIPGAGEFVYAAEPIRRAFGPGREVAENMHAEQGRANFLVALDQLQTDLPQCNFVLLVTAWFGNDLRMGVCAIKPGVEIAEKTTRPIDWRAGGVTRGGAHLISLHEGAPAFGGTPSDQTIVAAIQALKARGFRVGLYPFILVDVPAENALPDPYGGARQAAYPWRGRITLENAADDKTAAAAAQVGAFFGAASPGDFHASGDLIVYDGPEEWSFRRFILHNAKLAAAAGGVDAFVLCSELRGVTIARDSADHFPAIHALKSLAGDVRALLGPETTLTYGADWSEYRGHQPQDGSGDVFFHLDPLWADANIDVIGVDFYPPLTDWRDGKAHQDALLAPNGHNPAYLTSRIEGGEAYDWHYASAEDRDAQIRAPITDGAYGEPWIYRAKDVRSFWTNAHHDRPGGMRNAAPTDWVPRSKPFWFVELGCPAIDKGGNAPNLFIDPKSAESGLPPFSNGARDDLIQRRVLEAYLSYWQGDPMLAQSFVWTWDARPHPAFPARTDIWADGAAWRRGHWISGRVGVATLQDVVADLCARAGIDDADVAGLSGLVSGYVVDSPTSARAALEPLMSAYAFNAREHEGALVFAHADESEPLSLPASVLVSGADTLFLTRADDAEAPIEARVRHLDAGKDYLAGAASARRRDAAQGGVETFDAPLVLQPEEAEALAEKLLADRRATMESAKIVLAPAFLGLEPGDRVALSGMTFEIARIEDGAARALEMRRVTDGGARLVNGGEPAAPASPPLAPTPAFAILDLPPLPNAESDDRPLVAITAKPWLGAHALYAGANPTSATRRAELRDPAIMGELLWPLWPGPAGRWDRGNIIRVKLHGGALESVTEEALLAGANVFAIEGDDGAWEILAAQRCELVSADEYELSNFLRGLADSSHAMGAPTPAGRKIVKLDARLARARIAAHEWDANLAFTAPPAGAPPTDRFAALETQALGHVAQRPFRPVHLRAVRDGAGNVTLSWTRQARIGGLSWAAGEPPIGEPSELYLIEIADAAGAVVRSATVPAETWVYSAVAQNADFSLLPATLRFRAAQIGANGVPGLKTETTISL